GRDRRPGGAARALGQRRGAGLGPQPGAVRRRRGGAAPAGGPGGGGALHLGGVGPAPSRRLPAGRQGGRGAAVKAVVTGAGGYGAVRPEDLPLTEDAPLRPLTPYGASKVAAEYLALQAFLGERLPVIRVRAFNHTGPTQPDRFMIPGLARRIAAAERDGRKEI